MIKRSIILAMACMLLFSSFACASSPHVVNKGDGQEYTEDSWMWFDSDTSIFLFEGQDYHFWTDYEGTDAITREVTGYDVYLNRNLVHSCGNFFLDFRLPCETWKPLLKKGIVEMTVVVHTVYGDSKSRFNLIHNAYPPPLCDEHTWNVRSEKDAYEVCPKDLTSHYLKTAYVNRVCTVCGLEQKHETIVYSLENSPVVAQHTYDSNGICTAPGCAWNRENINRFYEDSEVPQSLTADLKDRASSGIVQVYTDMAEDKENDLIYQAVSEALKILTDPVGGTYDLVVDTLGSAQEKEVLERAVVEMLYGTENGTTTLSELAQMVDQTGNLINDGGFSIASALLGMEESSLNTEATKMAESVNFALSYAGRSKDAYDFMETKNAYEFFKYPENLDKLITKYSDYMNTQAVDPTTEHGMMVHKVHDDLLKLRKMMDEHEANANAQYKVDGINVGISAFFTALGIACNHFAAAESTDAVKEGDSGELYSLMNDRLQKIQILDTLMGSLDPSSALYDACRQVKSDVEKDLEGLASTDQRKALQKDGRLMIKFTCGTWVATAPKIAVKNIAGEVLATTALANISAEFITGGGVSDAINTAETIENLVFVKKALDSLPSGKMTYYQSELYYILAKKELDYASELNALGHTDSWLNGNDEKEKLEIDSGIIRAQRNLLDAQNEIRKDFFENAGLPFEAVNGYDPENIQKYLDGKYDLKTQTDAVPAYCNLNITGNEKYDPIVPFRIGGWELDPYSDFEILGIHKDINGERYLKVADTSGNSHFVKADDIPNCQDILDEKYSLYIDPAKSQVVVHALYSNGLVGQATNSPYYIGQNGDYAMGYYDILRIVVDDGVPYYKVRDTRGSEWYLPVSEVESAVQGTGSN